jgi:preprotein translocase subunit SecG
MQTVIIVIHLMIVSALIGVVLLQASAWGVAAAGAS